jgi:hypothetical protein
MDKVLISLREMNFSRSWVWEIISRSEMSTFVSE